MCVVGAPGQVSVLAFLRGVGFLALGTSLCLPFLTKGLVESKGLCAILSCCLWGFFRAEDCFWTTGSPPPTTIKNRFHPDQVLICYTCIKVAETNLREWQVYCPAWIFEIVASFPGLPTYFRYPAEQEPCSFSQKLSLLSAWSGEHNKHNSFSTILYKHDMTGQFDLTINTHLPLFSRFCGLSFFLVWGLTYFFLVFLNVYK